MELSPAQLMGALGAALALGIILARTVEKLIDRLFPPKHVHLEALIETLHEFSSSNIEAHRVISNGLERLLNGHGKLESAQLHLVDELKEIATINQGQTELLIKIGADIKANTEALRLLYQIAGPPVRAAARGGGS